MPPGLTILDFRIHNRRSTFAINISDCEAICIIFLTDLLYLHRQMRVHSHLMIKLTLFTQLITPVIDSHRLNVWSAEKMKQYEHDHDRHADNDKQINPLTHGRFSSNTQVAR